MTLPPELYGRRILKILGATFRAFVPYFFATVPATGRTIAATLVFFSRCLPRW